MKKIKNSKISFHWLSAFYKKLKSNSDFIFISQVVLFIVSITFFTLFLKSLYSKNQISLKNKEKENKFQRVFFSSWDIQAETIQGDLELKLGKDKNKSKVTVIRGNTGVEFSTRIDELKNDYDKQKVSFSNDNLKIDYQLLDNGIKEEIIINEKPESNKFTSEFKIKNLKAFYKNNIIVFEDKDENYQFHITEPYAYDAAGNVTHNVKYELKEIDAEKVLTEAFEEKKIKIDLLNNKTEINQDRKVTYQLITTVDKNWLNSNDRVYPITIDPTIVHDTDAEFSTGTYSKTHWDSTDSVIEMDEYGGPEVDANTIGYWSFDNKDIEAGYTATGGTITTDGDYTIHTFTSSGTFTANENMEAEVLVVAGGGGGGVDYGGGGGAGGLIHETNFQISSGANTVTIGAGGGPVSNGGNSVFSTLTAIGGGGGRTSGAGRNGYDGGSGGGCGYLSCSGGSGVAGQGYDGGGGGQLNYVGKGGGGAGEIGGTDCRACGGDGLAFSISGTSTYYAGGGGAAGSSGNGAGGLGGGAPGSTYGTNGTPNTGGGGGSSAGLNNTPGSGGSGIVIIRYLNTKKLTEDYSSQNNDATVKGEATSTTGKINNSKYFDGEDDYLEINNSDYNFTSENFSIDFWINPTSLSNTVILLGNGSWNADGYYLVLSGTGQLLFRTHQSGTHQDTSTTASVIEENKWQHVAITRDGSTINIYVDGIDVTYNHGSHTNPTSSNGNLVIGTYEDYKDPYYYKGHLDEFRISNTARTATEIKETYEKAFSKKSTYYKSEIIDLTNASTINSLSWETTTEKTSTEETVKDSANLVAQWKLNQASGNTAYESSLNTTLDGTLNGFADISSRDALFGSGWTGKYQKWGLGALVFDGTDDYISVPYDSSLNLTSALTISAWIKTNKTDRSDIVTRFNASNPWPGYGMIKGSNGLIGCWVGDNTNGYVYGTTKVDDNQWHQATCTYSNNTVSVYIDGKIESSGTRTPNLNETSTALRIGDNISSSAPFEGIIDNVSLYSRALDESEIRANYRATNLELQYRYSSDGINWSSWIGETANSLLNYSSFNEILDSTERENLSFSSTDISEKTNLEIQLATDQLGENTEVSFGETDFSILEPDANTVGLWHLDEQENISAIPATGGTITYVDGYYIHTFTGSSTFTAYQDLNAEVLVVAGGGGGGGTIGGGGGAGGVIHQDSYAISTGSHTVTIGAGGIGGVGWDNQPAPGTQGGNSVFSTLTAIGGGGGSSYGTGNDGTNGGSGGGGAHVTSAMSGTAGQGHDGGIGDVNRGGGGGGAGYAGTAYGVGGDGIISSISGTATWYGGGGGNGARTGYVASSGGLGGGGTGTAASTRAGDGTANTGGGGGGGGHTTSTTAQLGGNGGSGIVIVRYPDPKLTQSKKASGGIVTHANGKTIHTFTGGGTFTANENLTAQVLVVGGGGGGAGIIGGGGGAGGLIYNSSFSVNSGTYPITVGEGGRNGVGWNYTPQGGANGGNSVFSTLTAIGGGGGGGYGNTAPGIGGSGGGGSSTYPTGAVGTTGQGYGGGTGNTNDGGGGGGASAAGTNYGAGGDGLQYDISGTSTYYAGGGGGGGRDGSGTADSGGLGGGGNGTVTTIKAGDGTPNTGGGGGGAGYNGGSSAYLGGYGGSGIVIISYDNGGTLEDSSFQANHAAKMGSPESVLGKFGNAQKFDGIDDSLIIPANTSYDFTGDYTVEAWVNISELGNLSTIVGKHSDNGWGLNVNSTNKVNFGMHACSNFDGNTILEANKWYYIVGVYKENGDEEIYVNGILDKTGSLTDGNCNNDTSDVVIGRYRQTYNYFPGIIDEIRLSNIARSAEEIKQVYEKGLRTHKLTTNFKANLESSNLIANNNDLIFDISETAYGTNNDIENLHVGDTIIIREVVSTVEYLAEGVVSSANTTTGAVTVTSWLAGSTFPAGGFTTGASVFKWETKYLNIDNLRDDSIDSASEITFRELDDDANFWLKNVRAVSNLDSPVSNLNISNVRYFQYKSIFSSEDPYVSPLLGSVTLEYTQGAGTPIFNSSSIIDDIKTNDRTPTIIFESNSPNSEDLDYEVQWSTDSSFTTYSSADSSTNAGFLNTENAGDTAPFTTENAVSYTWQADLSNDNTYFYRVRAKISSEPGSWSEIRALTTDTSLPNNGNTWYQDKSQQFEGNTNGLGISTSSDTITTTTGTYSSLSNKISASSLHSVADYWKELSFTDTETTGDIKYQIMYDDLSTPIAIPDEVLDGNSTGFDDSAIDLTDIDTTTYPELYVKATLTNTAGTPSLDNWELSLNDIPEIPTLTDLTGFRTTTPTLNLYSTDVDNDYLQFKITLCTDSAMTTNCQTFDQTSSQTGWSGQNANSNTAYNSGSNASYTIQSALQENTTYYWKAITYDPNGSKHWSETQTNPSIFTTTTTPSTPDSLLAEGETNPQEVKDITPEFSAIYRDNDTGDYASYYQIQVSTDSSFTVVNMWDTGKTSMSNLSPDARMSDVSYAGNALAFNGATYYWRIRFWDSADYASPWSSSGDYFTMYTLMAPYNCLLVRDSQTNDITITWADDNPLKDSFTIQKSSNFGTFTNLATGLSGSTTEYLDENVLSSNIYQYRITTYSEGVQSPWCTTDILSIGLGNVYFEGLNMSGLNIN